MEWLEEFKEDVDRRSAYLDVEDDSLVIASHKTINRLIAIAEGAEKIMKRGLPYYFCSACDCPTGIRAGMYAALDVDDMGHTKTCPYSDEYCM